MNIQEYVRLLSRKKQTIISLSLLFLILSAILTFSQPLKYGAEAKLLVVQKTQYGTDPYQVNKANEYIGNVLADVVESNTFFNEVMNSGFDIEKSYFSEQLSEQMKDWKKTVSSDSGNRGVISVSVFHPDKYQADQIIRAINSVLKDKHGLYHGSGDQVEIRVMNQPSLSDFPVKPNIILNLSFGLFFGILFAFSYIYLFPENHYDLKLLPKKNKSVYYDEDEYEDETEDFNYPGVNKSANYDVTEAIKKLRQREKEQAGAPYRDYSRQRNESARPRVEERNNYVNHGQNNQNRNSEMTDSNRFDNLDYEEVIGRGSMKNVV